MSKRILTLFISIFKYCM